jgi:hypothetical protein
MFRASSCRGDFPGAGEDRVKHGLGEPAGKRVLLTRVVAAKEYVRPDVGLGSVTEPGAPLCDVPETAQDPQDAIPGETPEADNQPHAT